MNGSDTPKSPKDKSHEARQSDSETTATQPSSQTAHDRETQKPSAPETLQARSPCSPKPEKFETAAVPEFPGGTSCLSRTVPHAGQANTGVPKTGLLGQESGAIHVHRGHMKAECPRFTRVPVSTAGTQPSEPLPSGGVAESNEARTGLWTGRWRPSSLTDGVEAGDDLSKLRSECVCKAPEVTSLTQTESTKSCKLKRTPRAKDEGSAGDLTTDPRDPETLYRGSQMGHRSGLCISPRRDPRGPLIGS